MRKADLQLVVVFILGLAIVCGVALIVGGLTK